MVQYLQNVEIPLLGNFLTYSCVDIFKNKIQFVEAAFQKLFKVTVYNA